MKKWMKKAGILLAAALTVLLLSRWPSVSVRENKSADAPGAAGILRIWVCGDGSAMAEIRKSASQMEKKNQKVHVAVRRVPQGEWLTDGVVLPDMLILETEGMAAQEWENLQPSIPGMTAFVHSKSSWQRREWAGEFWVLLRQIQGNHQEA